MTHHDQETAAAEPTRAAPLRVDVGSGRLLVRRWGSGAPVVLLHPLALSGAVWEPVATRLAGSFQVLAVDARGHGGSSWDGEPFGIGDLAADVVGVLDGLGLASAHLVGLSMGGSVAVTVAGWWPERVRSLVLADTTAWYGEDAARRWAERAARARGVPRRAQLPFQLDRWFTEGFRVAAPEEVARVAEIFLATDPGAHAVASEAMGALDARPLLPAVTAPTLVLVGEEDYATPVADAATLTAGIPGATLRVLAGLRHLSLVERPELTADIAEHLRSAPAGEHPRSAPGAEHPRSGPGGEHPRSAPAGDLVDGGAGGAP